MRSEKENLYHALFHNTLDGVYLVQGSRLVLGNAALARMVGVDSAARLTGRDLREFIAPEEWPALQERLARRLQGEDPLPPITLTVVRRDGTRIRVQFSGALIQYEGQPTIVGVARDVSEAERAAAEAQRIHKVYMLGIEAFGGVPYTVDIATGRYDFLGGNIAAMTGFTPEELTPERFQRQIIRMDFQTNTGQLSREEVLRRRPDKLQAYYLFERKDGRRIWLFDASTPEFAPDGKFTRSFGILQDVTEARSIQERVRVYADLGRELNAANTALDAARVIARAAGRLIDHDACAVVLFAENMTTMRTVYLSDTFEGVRREVDPSGPDIPLSSLAQQVLNNGKVLLLLKPGDHLMGHRFGDTSRESASVIAAQLRLGDRAVGYLTLQSYRYNNYTDADLEVLQTLADHCAAGLERAALSERLRANEERFRAVWESAPSGMRIADANGTIVDVNPAFCALVGMKRDQLVGKPLDVYYAPESQAGVLDTFRARFREQAVPPELERQLRLWNGRTIWFQVANTFVSTSEGRVLLSLFRDRTTERRLEDELRQYAAEFERLATVDALTGLRNRRDFLDRLTVEVERAHRYNHDLSLIILDVDEFKQINDTHGHPVGDAVLARTGVIIRDIIRTSDIAARYGGDEFCIILPQTDLEGARALAERIRKALANATFSDQVAALQVTCSVGISRLGGNITNHSTLLNGADRALYQAKRLGRNRTEVVDSLTSV
ncbi:MAG: diguanylate cyclase [Candidatus Sumerlaeaceae bacterium]|nr:diguanylate cyclase [Candidatus Sumerlaeaceae bacterium]